MKTKYKVLIVIAVLLTAAVFVLAACNFGGGETPGGYDPPVDEIPGNGNGETPGNGNETPGNGGEIPAPVLHTLTLNAQHGGSVSGGGQFEAGANVTITATAQNGYSFAGWFEGENSFSTQNPHIFFMPNRNFTLTARFTDDSKTQVTIPALVQSSFVFDGTARTVQLTATNPAFSLGGVYSATNAGDYTAIITLVDTDNYEWANGTTAPLNLSWSIARLQVAMPTLQNNSFTFDGSMQSVTLNQNSQRFTLGGTSSATNAGDYVAVVTLVDTDNYEWANGTTAPISLTWEITRATPVYQVPIGLTATFGDTLADVALTQGWTWVAVGTTPVGNAGNQTHQARFTPADTVNFVTVTRDVTIDVAVLQIAMPTLNHAIFLYNGSVHTAVEITSTWITATGVSATNVGKHTATAALREPNNTQWTDGTTAPIILHWNIIYVQEVMSAGSQHSMVLDVDGGVWTWGNGENGRLGHGDTENRLVPTMIAPAAFSNVRIIAISAGSRHSMALDADGNVWTWGSGDSGRLGHNNTTEMIVPTRITHDAFSNATIIAISAGIDHSMALDAGGDVWTWGSGANGRLGHNNTTEMSVPTRITLAAFSNAIIIAISAGWEHSMALDVGGNVWTWGHGLFGRLGHNNTTSLFVPTRITNAAFAAANIIAISTAIGGSHNMALDSDGNVWTWGHGGNGRLGHGDTEDRLVPTAITHTEFTNTNIIAMYAGGGHNMALDVQGNVWTWGAGASGRLGHNNTEDRWVPAIITPAAFANANIIAISAGGSHSMAFDDQGNVWTWGNGANGRLGHGDTDNRLVPTVIEYTAFVEAMRRPAPAGSAGYGNKPAVVFAKTGDRAA